MKKILFVAFLVFVSCTFHTSPTPLRYPDLIPNTVSVKVSDKLYFEILPETELIAGILSQTSWMNKEGPDGAGNKYFQELQKFFAEHKKHRAMKYYEALRWLAGFSYDAPSFFILQLSKLPELNRPEKYPEYVLQRAKNETLLEQFRLALRDLGDQSRFAAFYNKHTDDYRKWIDQMKGSFPGNEMVQWFDGYFGKVENEYHIVLAPAMFPAGGYAAWKEDKGKKIIYEIIRADADGTEEPTFMSGMSLMDVCVHEFTHSFVNPALERRADLAEQFKLEEFYQPVSKIMKEQAYGAFYIFMNETVVRAATKRALLTMGHPAEEVQKFIDNEKDLGFYLIDFTIQQLEYYEQHRDEFQSFEDFVPYLYRQYAEHKTELLSIIEQEQSRKELRMVTFRNDLLMVCRMFTDKYVYLEDKTHKTRKKFEKECSALADQFTVDNYYSAFLNSMRKIRSWFPDGHLGWRLTNIPQTDDGAYLGDLSGNYYFLPIIMTLKNNEPVVAWRADALAEIPQGSKVISINGKAAEDVINEQETCAPQSTNLSSREVAVRTMSLYGTNFPCGLSFNKRIEFVFKYPDQSRHEKTLLWTAQAPFRITSNLYPSLEEIPASAKEYSSNKDLVAYALDVSGKKYGVIHFSGFGSRVWNVKVLKEAVDDLVAQGMEQLVIDLKDTAGGSERRTFDLLKAINVTVPKGASKRIVDVKNHMIVTGQADFGESSASTLWTGPVILRTNMICGSACDWFVAYFKAAKRGTIIGQTTAGRAASYSMHSTAHVDIAIPDEDFIFPFAKKSLEGRGVEPDVWCEDNLVGCLEKLEGSTIPSAP